MSGNDVLGYIRRNDVHLHRMKRLLEYFHACMSPEELALQGQLTKLGGPDEVLKDNKKLRALFEYKGASEGLVTRSTDRRYGAHASAETEFKDLQKELKTDINVAVRDNLKQFEAKFEMQRRELEELRRTMTSESDRVIRSFSSGPHERINDPVSTYHILYSVPAHATVAVLSRIFGRSGATWYAVRIRLISVTY